MAASTAPINRPTIMATWIDQNIGQDTTHKKMKARFESLTKFITQWFYFDSEEAFTSCIEGDPPIKMIAVMSGSMSRSLVHKHSNINALHSIYVFCFDVNGARQALQSEKKVKGVFDMEDDLYEKLADDIAKLLLEEGDAYAQANKRDLARLNYNEAKQILNNKAKKMNANMKKKRIEEIDDRLKRLLA